ncbi:MAG: sugar kinase [Phycisphaerae bacterium]|nr:sugar kinase [Phycisphaerae bacterium]
MMAKRTTSNKPKVSRKNGGVVCFGELLLRLDTKRHERFVQAREYVAGYTGAEANVAVCLSGLGVPTHVVSAVPDHEIGLACLGFIRQFGPNTDYVLRRGNRLGLLYVETGASQRSSKVVYDRAGSSFAELRPGDIDWKRILPGKSWFHVCGTAPALGEHLPAVVREACAAAKDFGLTVSCDVNYRSQMWPVARAREVLCPLMDSVDVLIANEEHGRLILGAAEPEQGASEPARAEAVARDLHRRYNLKQVAVTLRSGDSASETTIAAMLFDGETCCISREYTIHVVDRVGGGDALTAGLIYAFQKNMPVSEGVEFAAACACLKHTIPGDFALVSEAEVQTLVQGAGGGRVRR